MSRYEDRRGAPRRNNYRGGGNGQKFDNTNRGSLWENTQPKSDKSPHFNGTINVDGVEYWLNMWEGKKGGNNSPDFTLTVNPKDDDGDRSRGGGRREDRGRDGGGRRGGDDDGDRDRRGGERRTAYSRRDDDRGETPPRGRDGDYDERTPPPRDHYPDEDQAEIEYP